TGNNLGNTLIGNAAANILTGGTGDDILNGGAGADTMIGGDGDDTYIVDNIADIVTEDSNEGTDLVKASVSYTLGDNVENLELTGTAAINGTGNDDANIITGNAGNNILDGKGGIDTLIGGKGNDTYIVDDKDDEVIEAANEGIDLVKASVDYELTDFVENLTLTGNDHINGTGNALANIITGNAGNNILDGGAGVDKLIGGNGDDTYIVDLVRTGTTPANFKVALQDTITETANAGSDTVQLRLLSGTDYSTMANATTLTLGANLERFDASGTESIKLNLTGNALANTLTGNDADNILDGGAGVDTLQGGEGNDTYILDLKATAGILSIEDTVEEFNGTTDGIDTIKLRGTAPLSTAATLTLDNDWANVEILDASATGSTKLNLTGNNLGNTLIGNAAVNILTGGTGDDTLNGGAGADSMIGGDGDDTYIVDNIADIVTEDLNEGTDLVKASVSYTLGANIENLELTGTAAINGTGNGLDNVITGNAGNNILDGGAGADTLIGGKGNDTYIVDDEDDEVIEAANEGIDLVKASVSYTLSDNVENLTLTDGSANGGTAALNGTGNALANTITGNAGNNILDGGAGVDKLIGGNGDDTYIVDLVRTGTAPANYKVALQDTITETAVAGSGTDTVILRGSFTEPTTFTTLTIGANLENLDASFTGSTKLNLTGNALNNTLMGNDANNILDGGAGNDILIGGKGSDTLKGGLGADVFKWGADDLGPAGNISNSTDTITDFSVTQGDQLDLRDLLVGETEGNIFDYISVEAAGSSTVLHISTTGQFTGGSYNAGEEDTRIILSNTNLLMATGQSTYELAIQHMITNQSLLID
ncbi:calcium-binding protein, partial [Methylophilus sp. 1]|uniref:beta strand repeat-containing protein n=1 Tax=Methylophilus sp. 1 TaxID=1112273 RepID=UPI00038121F3